MDVLARKVTVNLLTPTTYFIENESIHDTVTVHGLLAVIVIQYHIGQSNYIAGTNTQTQGLRI